MPDVSIQIRGEAVTVTVPDATVAQLRVLVVEPTSALFSDAQLADFIAQAWYWDSASRDPSHESWIATFDLNAAAAEVWQVKAGNYAADYDFAADGGRYDRSQRHAHAMQQARHYRVRSGPRPVQFSRERLIGVLPTGLESQA